MNNLDKIYNIIQELIKDGITLKDEKEEVYKNQIDRIRYIKIDDYMVEIDESYNPNTKEKYLVRVLFVKTKSNNDVINFDNNDWYKNTNKIESVLMINSNYNIDSYHITISKPNGFKLKQLSEITSINNNTKFYSNELLNQLEELDNSYDSTKEYKVKRAILEERGKQISNEFVLEAIKNLDINKLKTGNFTNDNYKQSTMIRYKLYIDFLLENGARKDIIEMPAIKKIILDTIENGDSRVKSEGKSPISYRNPKEDGTFDIYGRTEGYASSVVYIMELDEQEENDYYICLTKKDIRDYLLFNESERKPDKKIYIDRNGKIIENKNITKIKK